MATLSTSDRARIQWVLDYISRSGGGGRYLDTKAADELAKVFQSNCGFRCGCGNFQQELKTAPVLTLLRAILCGDEGLVVPDPEGEVVLPGGIVIELDPEYPSAVFLGTACSYGVLAASTITNTGPTTIVGDLGLWPGTSVTGAPTIIGETHINDAEAQQAQSDLTVAYNDAQGRTTPAPTILAGDIGGQTLPPGLYKSTSSLAVANGALTFDGQGDINSVWIIQIASTFVMTAGRQILLIGGAQAKNIFWAVGSSVTLGTNSVFKGTLLTLTSDTLTTGAAVEGRVLARNAAVTLDSNSIVTPPCP